MSPPRVLMLCVSDTIGGAARTAYRIHNSVKANGIDSKMLVMYKGNTDDDVLCVKDFYNKTHLSEVARFIKRKIRNKLQHARWNKYPDKENLFMSDLRAEPFNGALQKIEFDVLHLHYVNLHFLDLRELVGINKPIVWTLHDCWPFTGVCHYFYTCNKYKTECGDCPLLHSGKKSDLSNKIWKKKSAIYRKLDLRIVSPSKWLAEESRKSSLMGSFPVHTIPNPIDTDLYSPGNQLEARMLLRMNVSKTYILFCAINAVEDKNKGYAYLLEALLKLKASTDISQFELLIVGSYKPQKELCDYMPVHYFGIIESEPLMVSIYRAVNITVVPSFSENFSNTILESLACGTPVVAFNIGGNADLIEHKRTGYLAQEFVSDDFADGINWCLAENLAGVVSQNARKKVIDNYGNEVTSSQYSQLYKSLISKA